MCAGIYQDGSHTKKFQDTWPTEEDFNQYSEVMRWRDLEKGIYKIFGYRETRNNYGIAVIYYN